MHILAILYFGFFMIYYIIFFIVLIYTIIVEEWFCINRIPLWYSRVSNYLLNNYTILPS
jgi:hypothetical protein